MVAAARMRAGAADLAQPLEQHRPAQREPERVERGGGVARRQRAHDEVEIARLARVIQPRPPVGEQLLDVARIARARAEVQHRGAPSGARDQQREPLRVQRVGAALQPVQQQHARRRRRPRHMVEHQVVVVGRGQHLALEGDQPPRARDARPRRLQVRAGNPPCGDHRHQPTPAAPEISGPPRCGTLRRGSGAVPSDQPGLWSPFT